MNEVSLMDMKLISCIVFKARHIDVYRDKWGKFYVRNNGIVVQRKLNAEEIIRWLTNCMQDA